MAESFKTFGQVALPATARTVFYTVPAATQAVCSSIEICNRTNGNLTYRLGVAVAGAADDAKQYIAFDSLLLKNSTTILTIGQAMGAGDQLFGFASAVGITMQASGTEIT